MRSNLSVNYSIDISNNAKKILNSAQLKALRHGCGPALVLAAPGSGKTSVIVGRVKNLIEERKVCSENILVVTFSRAAANEMELRYKKESNANSKESGAVTFGTFHSVFFEIIRNTDRKNLSKVISDSRKFEIIKSEIDALKPDFEDEEELINDILSGISKLKSQNSLGYLRTSNDAAFDNLPVNTVISHPFISGPEFIKIYKSYERELKACKLVDFEDMMGLCLKLLLERPEILRFWQHKFKYILVDEFQDINRLQYEVLKMLAAPENNIFAVGDDDQSIYGFRGSDPNIMRQFLSDFSGAAQMELNVNYRSRPEIIQAASVVISENKHRFKKKIRPASEDDIKGHAVHINKYQNKNAECKGICRQILRLFKDSEKGGRAAGKTAAILVRRGREADDFARHLEEHGIPCEISGKRQNHFEHFIVRDILAYLRIAQGLKEDACNRGKFGEKENICAGKFGTEKRKSGARADWLRIINKPSRYISREAFQMKTDCPHMFYMRQLKSYYHDNPGKLKEIFEFEKHLLFLSKLKPFAAIKYIRSAIGYDRWLMECAQGNDLYQFEYIFRQLETAAKKCSNFRDFEKYIRDFSNNAPTYTSLDVYNGVSSNIFAGKFTDKSETKLFNGSNFNQEAQSLLRGSQSAFSDRNNFENPVKIMTMHASKGLEFDTVFIPGVNEGNIPNLRALNSATQGIFSGGTDNGAALEEERRLFYVAMTRAKSHLYISFSETGKNGKVSPSRFIKPLIPNSRLSC